MLAYPTAYPRNSVFNLISVFSGHRHLGPEGLLLLPLPLKTWVDQAPGLYRDEAGEDRGHELGGGPLTKPPGQDGVRGDRAFAPAIGQEADVGPLLVQGHQLDVLVRQIFGGVELKSWRVSQMVSSKNWPPRTASLPWRGRLAMARGG